MSRGDAQPSVGYLGCLSVLSYCTAPAFLVVRHVGWRYTLSRRRDLNGRLPGFTPGDLAACELYALPFRCLKNPRCPLATLTSIRMTGENRHPAKSLISKTLADTEYIYGPKE